MLEGRTFLIPSFTVSPSLKSMKCPPMRGVLEILADLMMEIRISDGRGKAQSSSKLYSDYIYLSLDTFLSFCGRLNRISPPPT